MTKRYPLNGSPLPPKPQTLADAPLSALSPDEAARLSSVIKLATGCTIVFNGGQFTMFNGEQQPGVPWIVYPVGQYTITGLYRLAAEMAKWRTASKPERAALAAV